MTLPDEAMEKYRVTTPAENLRILAARLSEHLSPAEKRELEQAAAALASSENRPMSNLAEAGADIIKWIDSVEVQRTLRQMGSLSLTHPHLGVPIPAEFSAWAKQVWDRFRTAIDAAMKGPTDDK